MQHRPILVVDDESEMRIALAHALKRSGFTVETAGNGREALKKFSRESFGMVITDEKMPEMSGTQVLEAIRKQSADVPVIMMTAYGTIPHAVSVMQEGADDYLLKPFSAEVLDGLIKKYAARMAREADGPTCPQEPAGDPDQHKQIITRDDRMMDIIGLAKNIATSRATVLIQGESGTGKELLASMILR